MSIAGDGVVGGGLASIPKVSDVFAQMGHAAEGAFAPSLSVPPSAVVARYAAQPADVEFDYDRLALAVVRAAQASPVHAEFKLDSFRLANAVASVQHQATRRKPVAPFLKTGKM